MRMRMAIYTSKASLARPMCTVVRACIIIAVCAGLATPVLAGGDDAVVVHTNTTASALLATNVVDAPSVTDTQAQIGPVFTNGLAATSMGAIGPTPGLLDWRVPADPLNVLKVATAAAASVVEGSGTPIGYCCFVLGGTPASPRLVLVKREQVRSFLSTTGAGGRPGGGPVVVNFPGGGKGGRRRSLLTPSDADVDASAQDTHKPSAPVAPAAPTLRHSGHSNKPVKVAQYLTKKAAETDRAPAAQHRNRKLH